MSIKSFPDYIYYKKTTWNTNIFFFYHYLSYLSCLLLELSYILKKKVCIPRSFLVINVCDQGKTLCSPCISSTYRGFYRGWTVITSCNRKTVLVKTGRVSGNLVWSSKQHVGWIFMSTLCSFLHAIKTFAHFKIALLSVWVRCICICSLVSYEDSWDLSLSSSTLCCHGHELQSYLFLIFLMFMGPCIVNQCQ